MIDSDRTSRDSEQALAILRRRAPWILLCVALVAGAAYGYSKHQTKKYTAVAALAFDQNSLSQQIAGLSNNGSVSQVQQVEADVELVKVGDMAAKTARLLGQGLTDEGVVASVSVSAQGETNIVEVAATATSPVLAAAIANTYAAQFVKEQQGTNRRFFKSALALVNKQLAGLSPAQRFGSDGLDLQERAHTLGLLAELGYNKVQVVQHALPPSSPSSPATKRNTILAAILGLLLGVGVALLLERFDDRIREPKELEAIYHLPMLGGVANGAALSRPARQSQGRGAVLSPAEAEAFSLIRAHLRFFNVDRDLRTLAIASPAPGDGKTTIARHLAQAAARSGSRVLLMELDLRHPTLAEQFGIQPGPGLAGALIGICTVDEATQSVSFVAPSGGNAQRTLDVLVAGDVLPPNPGELLESYAMGAVLSRSKAAYDFVVIDTPSLAVCSDAFPLLTKVDGVVIVGRIGHSKRDVAEQLQQVLADSGVPLLGVVANGVKSTVAGSYSDPGKNESSPTAAPMDRVSSSEGFASAAKV
jgi:polysaccharide biosynthesis transport protein